MVCFCTPKVPNFFDRRKKDMRKIVIGAVLVGVAFVLYCCVRAGAQEDKRMEELHRGDNEYAGRTSGYSGIRKR